MTPGRIVLPSTLQVRSEQHIDMYLAAQFLVENLQPSLHQQDGRGRLPDDFLDQTIEAVAFRLRQPVQQNRVVRVFDLVLEITFFLMATRLAVGDEKLEIPRVR